MSDCGIVPGAWCLVPGAWCLVPGAWCLVPGAWCLVPGAWCLVCCGLRAGAWCVVALGPVPVARGVAGTCLRGWLTLARVGGVMFCVCVCAPGWFCLAAVQDASSRTGTTAGVAPFTDLATYPMGIFIQDYEFSAGSGHLDQYNGRFCATPDYPGGTYAYFLTTDAETGEPAFPYIVGTQYYGSTTGAASPPGTMPPGCGNNDCSSSGTVSGSFAVDSASPSAPASASATPSAGASVVETTLTELQWTPSTDEEYDFTS